MLWPTDEGVSPPRAADGGPRQTLRPKASRTTATYPPGIWPSKGRVSGVVRSQTMNDTKKSPKPSDVYKMVLQASVEYGIDAGQAAIIAKRVESLYAEAQKKPG